MTQLPGIRPAVTDTGFVHLEPEAFGWRHLVELAAVRAVVGHAAAACRSGLELLPPRFRRSLPGNTSVTDWPMIPAM